MIHCLTSSYAKDFARAAALNKRLTENNVVHHIFVEFKDLELFDILGSPTTYIHMKPDGGEGGLGRDGTMARFPCYKTMQQYILPEDCYVQLDSDVIIDEEIIPNLACMPNEIKGFFNPKFPTHLQRDSSIAPTNIQFWHFSGMTICAGYEIFNKSIPKDKQEMLSIIDFLLSEGFTPSEDVVLSYMLQRGEFTLTNLEGNHYRVFHTNGDIEVHTIDKLKFEPTDSKRQELIYAITI